MTADNICYTSDDPLQTPPFASAMQATLRSALPASCGGPAVASASRRESDAMLSPRGRVSEPPSASTLQVNIALRTRTAPMIFSDGKAAIR